MLVRIGASTPADVWGVIEGDTIGAGASVALPPGFRGTVTAVGPAYRSAPGPEEIRATITFLVEQTGGVGRDVLVGLFSAWLYDHRGHFKAWINRKPVDLDNKAELDRLVDDELEALPEDLNTARGQE